MSDKDKLYPESGGELSVDEILAQVRAMRENAEAKKADAAAKPVSDGGAEAVSIDDLSAVSTAADLPKEQPKDTDGLTDFLDKPARPFSHKPASKLSPEEIMNLNRSDATVAFTPKQAAQIKTAAEKPPTNRPSGFRVKVQFDDKPENDEKPAAPPVAPPVGEADKANESTLTFEPIHKPHNLAPDDEPDGESKDAPRGKFENVPVVSQEDEAYFGVPIARPIDEKPVEKTELDGYIGLNTKKSKARLTRRPVNDVQLEFLPNSIDSDDDYIEDYRTISDAQAVREDLEARRRRLNFKLTATGVLTALSFLLTLLPGMGRRLIPTPDPSVDTMAFLTVAAVIFALGCIINLSTVALGLFSLVKLRPSIDTAVAISVAATTAQTVAAFCNPLFFSRGYIGLYSTVTLLALLFNLLGKKSMISRISQNFPAVATTAVKQSCFIASDEDAEKMAGGATIGCPRVACSRSVVNLHNYLKNSYCEDPADNMCKTLSFVGLLAALIIGGVVYFLINDGLNSQDALYTALSCVAAAAAAAVPLTSLLATNLPLSDAAKKLREAGGMFSGYNAVEDFADTECAVIDSEELFGAGSVELLSLKAIGETAVEDVILDAASLVITAGGPLADVFDKIIDGRRKMLPKAQNIYYEDGKGLTGSVSGKNVCVGNRTMMESISVTGLPDAELDARLGRSGSSTVYLSRDGVLSGMFVVKYTSADEQVEEQLRELIDSGVIVMIKTNDPNITAELIGKLFSVDADGVRIMPSDAVLCCENATAPRENGDSVFAHDNSVGAFMAGIVTAARLRTRVAIAVVLQTLFVIVAVGAVMFFAMTGQGGEFSFMAPQYIFAYQICAALLTLLLPSFRRL